MSAEAVEPYEADLTQGTGKDITVTRGLNAFALMLAGASDTQIARQLGFNSPGEARSSWERLLADTVTPEQKDKVRRAESARLDRMQQSWWSKAIDPNSSEHLTASRMVITIMERRAKLLGLDAPTRVDVYTPASAEIMAYVEMLRAHAGVEDEVEPDIIEVEILGSTPS